MTDRNWWPEGYDLPAFRVKRQTYGLEHGGDWVRGSSVTTLPHTALRYPTTIVEEYDPTLTANQSILYCRPFDYNTVELFWNWPIAHAAAWQEVALVRSTFGVPSTPRDGQTIFRALRTDFTNERGSVPAPVIYDQMLPSGRWYYYSLFFRVNQIDWVLAMSDACVLPRDYRHREYMWNVVPPYYQWMDDNQSIDGGPLQQFLTVFGFALDNTREFVEGLLNLHNIDVSPMALLKGLGANYGLPYESGIGDIRYRGLVANAPNAQHTRGTAVGLQRLIESVSKYETGITGSPTMMLFPDDSDFFGSTGNWGGMHPDAVVAFNDAVAAIVPPPDPMPSLAWNKIHVNRVNKNPQVGRGVMRVYTAKADEAADIIIAVGNSRIQTRDYNGDGKIDSKDVAPIIEVADDKIPAATTTYLDAIPLETAISVIAGVPYGFSLWLQAPEKSCNAQLVLAWIGPSGEPQEVISVRLGNLDSANATWKQFLVTGYAPKATATAPEGRYVVPMIYAYGRQVHTLSNRSSALDVCGAMFYQLGDENSGISVTPPDRYLSMGVPSEKIGSSKTGFEGFVLGSPTRKRST